MHLTQRACAEITTLAASRTAALALGAKAEVAYTRGYPVTVNTPENTDFAADTARAVSGKVDTDTAPLMGATVLAMLLTA